MPNKRLWFKAKRYGWGWYPCSKEGWLVLLVYVGIFVSAQIYFMRHVLNTHSASGAVLYFMFVVVLTLALIRICYTKGEKPRWRWGKD